MGLGKQRARRGRAASSEGRGSDLAPPTSSHPAGEAVPSTNHKDQATGG